MTLHAFDADVLIYASSPQHQLGRRVRPLFVDPSGELSDEQAGVGSVLLEPEVLAKPARLGATAEVMALARLLVRLDLRPVGTSTSRTATALAAKYGLKPIDAVHLATAVEAGADVFVTNNTRDFTAAIEEIEIVTPADLPEPT